MNEIVTTPSIESGIYRHYKGNEYRILGVGRHTETHEDLVVYEPIEKKDGSPVLWIRPYDMFIEMVEVGGEITPRFKKVR